MIEEIAKNCHEANKSYCESIGDYSQSSWEQAPEWQKQSAMNGVKFHLDNDVTPKDSHKNWMKEKLENGWKYGEEKNSDLKTHPCMMDYEFLPANQRVKDDIFKSIVDSYKEEK